MKKMIFSSPREGHAGFGSLLELNLAGTTLLFSILKIIDVDPPTQYEEKPKQNKVGERHLNWKAWHAHVWSSSNYHEYRDSDD